MIGTGGFLIASCILSIRESPDLLGFGLLYVFGSIHSGNASSSSAGPQKFLFNITSSSNEIVVGITSMLGQGKPLYMIIYAAGIIFFSFFYTSIIFNPKETAENLRKYGGFVPGIRPGEQTEQFIDQLLLKLTVIGSLYLVVICLLPEFIIANYPIPFYLGGTSLLIVSVVAMDTVAQVQTRLMSQQYESLIKKTKFNR